MNTPSQSHPMAMITGASSGIGYELAKVFAKNGYDLLIAAEDVGISDAGNALRGMGVNVESMQVDLATYEGVERLYNKMKFMGPFEAVALNAGVGVAGEFKDTALEDELNLLNLNIVSLVHMTKKVLPDFIEQGHGKILFTSSIAATMPGPYYAVYAASKAFVQSFAEAIRYEVKDKNIFVTSLQPGATDTNFFARAGMLDTKAGVGKKDDAAEVAQQGFEALMANRDHVVAGSLMNNVQAVMAKWASEQQGAAMHARETKPGSAHS